MNWVKEKARGQMTVSALISIIVLITAIATPILYVTDIKADANMADSGLDAKIAIEKTRVDNLEENYKELNVKIDWLIRQQGGIPTQIVNNQYPK